MGIHMNKMSPMYHTGKNGVKASKTLTKEFEHGKCDNLPETDL